MITRTWRAVGHAPYFVPYGFGGSIFIASPFLLLLFRPGRTHAKLKWLAWGIIGLLTLILWCHGNPGGWQYSYRYGLVLLPWIFLVVLESQRGRPVSLAVILLLVLSIGINVFATFLYYWTSCVAVGEIPNPCL